MELNTYGSKQNGALKMTVRELNLKEIEAIREYFSKEPVCIRIDVLTFSNGVFIFYGTSDDNEEYRIIPRYQSPEPIDRGEKGAWAETGVACEKLIPSEWDKDHKVVESSEQHSILWQYAKA